MSELLTLAAMLRELASLPGLVVLVPLAAAAGLAWAPLPRLAATLAAAAATATFLLACALPFRPVAGLLLLVDPLAAHVAILTGFVGAAAAWSVAATPPAERADTPAGHALFLASLGCLLLALLSNNALVTWGAIAAACIGSVGVVGLPGTPHARVAAFRQLMLCGVGIALASLGTVLLWLAAAPALGPGLPAMSWSRLATAPGCNAAMLNLAFVFLLLGYATKAGLAPLHGWLTAACAEAPTPVAAVLAGSLPNAALLVILRLRGVLDANSAAIDRHHATRGVPPFPPQGRHLAGGLRMAPGGNARALGPGGGRRRHARAAPARGGAGAVPVRRFHPRPARHPVRLAAQRRTDARAGGHRPADAPLPRPPLRHLP